MGGGVLWGIKENPSSMIQCILYGGIIPLVFYVVVFCVFCAV